MKQSIQLRQIACQLEYQIYRAPSASAPHLLLLHGHSSSLGEFDKLLPFLAPHAHLYLVDLPSCGGSTDVDADRVRSAFGKYPSLEYLRDVVAEFVRLVVMPRLPGPKSLRVAGGSLGGNLTLWLATQPYSWLKDALVWSPGSAWKGDLFQVLGASTALHRAKENWAGRRNEFLRGAFVENVVDVLGIPGLTRPQPWYWFYDKWGGGEINYVPVLRTLDGTLNEKPDRYPKMSFRKATEISNSFRHAETRYTAKRAAWHWQVAGDQLAFSHRETVRVGTRSAPRIAGLRCDTKFMAGVFDNSAPADLYNYTWQLYRDAENFAPSTLSVAWEAVPGSGHSVHSEKPAFLAERLLGVIDD